MESSNPRGLQRQAHDVFRLAQEAIEKHYDPSERKTSLDGHVARIIGEYPSVKITFQEPFRYAREGLGLVCWWILESVMVDHCHYRGPKEGALGILREAQEAALTKDLWEASR